MSADSGENRTYKAPEQISREEALLVLAGDDEDQIGTTLYSLSTYEKDIGWVEAICLKFADDERPYVRAMALQSLGVLARIHPKEIDYSRVLTKLIERILDSNNVYSPFAEEAISDALRFHWQHVDYLRTAIEADLSSRSETRAFVALDGIAKCESDLTFAVHVGTSYLEDTCPSLRVAALNLFANVATKIDFRQVKELRKRVAPLMVDPVPWVRETAQTVDYLLEVHGEEQPALPQP